MRLRRVGFGLFLLAAVLATAKGRGGLAFAEPAIRPDFAELYHLASVYRSIRYESSDSVRAEWSQYYRELAVVELPLTRNRYLLGTAARSGVQEVVIRGTANLRNALFDAAVVMEFDEELGIAVHRGFDAIARAAYVDLAPRLDPKRPVVLFGHSLGAAQAVIVGILLQRHGYRVLRVYASGQPKITDRGGADRYAQFPVLRVSLEKDPVPLLPVRLRRGGDPWVHFGPEILLLDGPYYAVATERPEEAGRLAVVFRLLREQGARGALREHLIASYLERLQAKQVRAIEVPYAERGRYASD